MARMHRWVGVVALGLALGGCVSQEKYNALKLDRDQLGDRLAQAELNSSELRTQAEMLKNQLAAFNGAGGTKDAVLANLTASNAQLQKDLDELNRKYMDAIGRTVAAGPALPEKLTSILTEFAAKYPDLVDFDAHRGIVKFKSDVTFALGDATLTPKAREVIAKFATILGSPDAANYELMVAGHTDSTRVSNPATIQAGHKDNWYLSAHRAIAVGEELQSQRISAQRLGVTGYADQRPVASNGSSTGQAQNRRVEVLILPSTVRGSQMASGTGTAVPASATKSRNSINKDIVMPATPPKPMINK
jgi:chemotaxis protein MotB